MIANTILAASALVSLVAAVPMAQPPFPKRDVVWETHTEVALTTIGVTVTHWLEPGETPPTEVNKQHYGHKGHGHSHGTAPAQPETTATPAPQPPASSPDLPAAPPSSYEQPAPPPAAPTTPVPAPEPTTAQASPPAYTPSVQPSPQPQPQPSQPSSGGSAPSGEEYSGDITHYDVGAGLGSCGEMHSNSEDVVAMAHSIMEPQDGGNPNNNPLCGKTITISYDGSEHTAKIVDKCPGCDGDSIDLSPTLFEKVAPNGDGRVSDVKWWFNGA